MKRRIRFGKSRRKRKMKALLDSSNYKVFRLEEGFEERVRESIMNPEFHANGKPTEVCGAFNIYLDESVGEYVIQHDSSSVSKNRSNENGFHMGGLEDGVQFCHPKKYVHNVLWHTHPKGVPAYPSGSDVFVTIINDCTEGLTPSDSTAQAFVEFLFTEHGFWVIYRNVYDDGSIASPLDFTETRGRAIKMNRRKMISVEDIRDQVDDLIEKMEAVIIKNYYRNPVPDQQAVDNIQQTIDSNPEFLLVRNRIRFNFYPWGTDRIQLPEILFTTPVVGICIAN